jgi:hypothetical protein
MTWWNFYYTHKFNKILKVNLQQLCLEYDIDPKQTKNLLIQELTKHFTPTNTNQDIVKS